MFLKQYKPVTVKLQVARHLAVRHSIGRLLQAQRLEVHADAAVRDDEVRVHGTFDGGSAVTRGAITRVNLTFHFFLQLASELLWPAHSNLDSTTEILVCHSHVHY